MQALQLHATVDAARRLAKPTNVDCCHIFSRFLQTKIVIYAEENDIDLVEEQRGLQHARVGITGSGSFLHP